MRKLIALAALLIAPALHAQSGTAVNIPTDHLIPPAELNTLLAQKPANPPLILQVGSKMMYAQAHIPSAEYIGAGSQSSGINALNGRVASLKKSAPIILYCGCCPWGRCPNVGPAYAALAAAGFTNVIVLYLENDFGTDWAGKGYPVAH